MNKMWAGRLSGKLETSADRLNASFPFDQRMLKQDLAGNLAHAQMLGKQGIITQEESDTLQNALEQMLAELEKGTLQLDETSEDVHMAVEQELTKRLGDIGKKIHTARSRNDQVALDFRMYLRDETDAVIHKLSALVETLCVLSETHLLVLMPGYTHLQHAQPVLFSHHMMAYAMMFLRDISRFRDCRQRMNLSPIGSGALSGTTFPVDRQFEAKTLFFDDVCKNSMDAVGDRDFALDFLYASSVLMMHLSRMAEELVLWSSWEFQFIELGDDFSTGSSMMPQKKNPDMAELIRGKTGRVYGDLMALLTVLKGLPLAYNKDIQEDKEPTFDAADTINLCLEVLTPMLQTMRIREDKMLLSAQAGFMNATDLADYLVGKGMPFRSAYKVAGEIVTSCIQESCNLENYPLEKYQAHCDKIEQDVYQAVDLVHCVKKRSSQGGTSPDSVLNQIKIVREELNPAFY